MKYKNPKLVLTVNKYKHSPLKKTENINKNFRFTLLIIYITATDANKKFELNNLYE